MSTKTLMIQFRQNLTQAHTGDIDLSPRIMSLTSLSHENLDDEEHRTTHVHAKHLEPALPKDVSSNQLNYSDDTTLKTPVPLLSKELILPQISYTVEQRIEQVQKGEHVELCISSSAQDLAKGAMEMQDLSGKAYSSFTNSYKKIEDGKLEMINTVLLKKQKQVLGFLIKQFGSMLFSGKSVMNISLPITIFEPRTLLEKIADSFAFAPYFLEKAARTADTLEQFKLAFAYFVTNLSSDLNPQKPCNPAPGETFQGIIGGCPVYVEQISSQPPLAAFQMLGNGFTLEGNSELQASISVNSVKCRRVGSYKIIFKNTGSIICVQFPDGIMNGTAFGKRVWSFSRKLQVYDPQNCYYAELDFDKSEPSKKKKDIPGYFSNGIHKTTEKFMTKAMQDIEKAKDADIKFKEKEHSVLKLADFEGSWLEFLTINDEDYWRFGNIWPYKVQYFDNPLPSDSNFRCDLLHLKNNEEDKAQEAKMLFEELQRGDKKLREAGKAKRK